MHVADYPDALADVLLKALAKEPGQRFATMRDFADALEAAASKLGEHAGAQGIEAFIHEALDARKEARAAQIKEARRAADEREGVRTSGVTATPLPAVVAPVGPSSEDSSVALASAASSSVIPERRGGAVARAVGLVSLGAILGAVALIWATRGAPTPTLSTSSLAATLAPTLAPSASAAVTVAPPPPAVEAVASVGQKTSAPAPSTSATAPPATAASITAPRSTVKIVAPAPKGDPAGKFRNPGF